MFITNRYSHYFVVDCSIDVAKLKDCKVHKTLDEMYNYVCETNDMYLDEVANGEIEIYVLGGDYREDGVGGSGIIDFDDYHAYCIEDVISDYEL